MDHLIAQPDLYTACTEIDRYPQLQYPSMKSLRSTIVEQSYGANAFAERHSRTVFSSVPSSFCFHSILLANQRDLCKHEVSVNASFRSEDDLQLLQMVVEGSKYESASFCIAARAYSDPESWLINYARTQQRAKQKRNARTRAELIPRLHWTKLARHSTVRGRHGNSVRCRPVFTLR